MQDKRQLMCQLESSSLMATESKSEEREAKSRVGVVVATFRYQSKMREQPWDSETCQRLARQNNHTDPKTLRSGAARDP